MHVVAIKGAGRQDGRLGSILARVTGTTEREANGRVASRGPRVVATYADEDAACVCAAALRRGGLDAFVLGDGEIERDTARLYVRDFAFRGDRLWIGTRRGRTREIAFDTVELLLRLNGNLGGGAGRSAEDLRRRGRARAAPSAQLLVYGRGMVTLAFRADEVWYQALGSALRPGRMANFAQLVAELRSRCPAAVYDERLVDRATQARILGPLRPEAGLDVATSIVARGYRTRAPYRSDRAVGPAISPPANRE